MSKTRKTLAVCLAISAISTVVMVVSSIINPESASIATIVCTGIVPVVLCISLLSSAKDEGK